VGQSVLATSGEVAFSSIFISMVSGGGLVVGREFRLGALTFVADDFAWLQEAPLNVEALPARGSSHFRAISCGVLLRQPSSPYQSVIASSSHSTGCRRKRSGCSRLQRWVRHAVAHQAFTPQVAAIEPDVFPCGSVDLLTDFAETLSESGSCDPAAEVLMVNSHHGPPGFHRNGDGGRSAGTSIDHEEYQPQPLTSQHREELHRRNVEALQTPIIGETAEARALEAVRLATLAERTRLENLQHSLNERVRRLIPESSRRS